MGKRIRVLQFANVFIRNRLYKLERIFGVIPDKTFLKIQYYFKTGNKLDLNNPKGFCEKIQWIKLYDRKQDYIEWSDKIIAKQKAAQILGSEHIIPTIVEYDDCSHIDLSELPDKFVIKCNHDSGGVVVCEDKEKFDLNLARSVLNGRLKRNFYYHAREWAYKDIHPRVFVEKYISGSKGELYNYKFYCFNGMPKFLYVSLEKILDGKKTAYIKFYNLDWTEAEFGRKDHPTVPAEIKKPDNLDEMINMSKRLSDGVPFARVDFYDVDGSIYFSEMTFYPGGGLSPFYPQNYEQEIGSWINLK